jgi:lysyl-tRNA synthetase, class II
MPRLENIVQQRLEKLKKIRDRGINPYPNSYHRSHIIQEAIAIFQQHEKKGTDCPEFSLAGRVVANRPMGKIAFMNIKDSSGKVQLHFSRDSLGVEKYQCIRELDIGDIIGVSGKLFRTKTEEITLEVADFSLLSKALQTLPEKWHGLVDVEKRFRQRYLDLISNDESMQLFVQRSKIMASLRQFLNKQDFVEVETPVLQSIAGGALARPFITHHQALDQDLYMRIALELHLKRLIIGGFDKVYEIGRVFRNEGISTKHNPEFTMIEIYQAYADYNDMMQLVEDMVSTIAKEVLGTTKVKYGKKTINLEPPWGRLPLREAVKDSCGIDFFHYPDTESLRKRMEQLGNWVDPTKDRGRLIDELVSTYVEPNLIQPTFLVDYPVDMSPLAKNKPDSDKLVERFEAFAGTMEIANSFTELNDPHEQEKRFRSQLESRLSEDEEQEVIDDDFLLALEYGMPPTGGLGIGIDRLIMLLTNKQSIREVILFPQLKTK